MANWAALQEQLTGKRVVKRAKHSIHFDNGNGSITANFSGKPCHYQDTDGLWKPIDTKLLLAGDGWYGSPHSDVKIHPNGQVKVTGSDYEQFTELPSAKKGVLAGDRIIRTFPGGYQELFVTEDGFREVITVNKPTFPIEKFLAKQSGTLPSAYKTSPQTAVDANGNEFVITSDTKAFGDWLASAVYPVIIDPDFTGVSTDEWITGYDATTYAAARDTRDERGGGTNSLYIGQNKGAGGFQVWRAYVAFDTSSIDDGATVTQANLKLTVFADNSTTDFDVQIAKYDWSAWNGGPDAAKMETAYDGCLTAAADDNIWRNTNGISENNQYTSGNLSTAWVSKTGITYYGLRSSRDVAATEPTGAERIRVASMQHATESYRPVLTVTYTAGGALLKVNMNAQMQNLSGNIRG